jgi:hypothetical protein
MTRSKKPESVNEAADHQGMIEELEGQLPSQSIAWYSYR